MQLSTNDELAKAGPDKVFGVGVGSFLNELGIPLQFAVTFGMLAFATFVYDTLDVCTRLARYLFVEFTGWRTKTAGVVGTIVSLAVPAWFVAERIADANGKTMPAYKVVWPLFGSINQLLAALTLVGLSLWLAKSKRGLLVRALVGIPMLFMMAVTITALSIQIYERDELLLRSLGIVLLVLALWITTEAVISLWQGRHGAKLAEANENDHVA
jgi:carbon starvation protein